jgi:RNA polymerase sigma-70 factor (ECF subfamily)
LSVHTLSHYQKCRKLAPSKNTNEYSLFKSNVYEKFKLQKRVQDELLRFAYKLTTDREEANDLLQETSLKALDNEDKYMPDTNFKGWMYTIMRNIFINNYRKVVRDQTFIDQTDNLYHLNLPQDTGFESTERTYDLKEMHRVVNALPKEYRVPFAMHVSGFKYREIAEKLNLPLGTVKSRIFFTRQKLQEELKDFR